MLAAYCFDPEASFALPISDNLSINHCVAAADPAYCFQLLHLHYNSLSSVATATENPFVSATETGSLPYPSRP